MPPAGKYLKKDHTPEEWAEYLAKVRAYRQANIESYRARARAYSARPEVKEKRRAHDAKPSHKTRRLANNRKPENIAKAKALMAKKLRDPAYRSRHNAQIRQWHTGFTQELFDALIKHQRNRCGSCGVSFDGKQHVRKPHADHCHKTRVPRGILCFYCNTIEGMLDKLHIDPVDFGKRLSAYLRHPPALALRVR